MKVGLAPSPPPHPLPLKFIISLVGHLSSHENDPTHLPNLFNMKLKNVLFNSLTTKKQTTKFSSANFQKMLSQSYIILRIQRLEGKQCRSR